jgi:phosphoribosylformylglycinamidine cyclo-ligase
MRKTLYEQRGVSSQKKDVHKAIANLDKGLYPGAFCKILPDHLAESPRHCNIMHTDTAGTKTSLAYLYWKITGDLDTATNIAIDTLVMNVDDVACVGSTGPFLVNQTLGINSFRITAEFFAAVMQKAEKFCSLLRDYDIPCYFAGGETASVGDVVRTIDVGGSLTARMKRRDVIDASRMKAGDIIVGFSSTGQAKWEDVENSGMGSNGLTNGRHDLLAPIYRKHTETYAPEMKKSLVYRGKYQVRDNFPEHCRINSGISSKMSIGKALLSPTRTYVPLIKAVLDRVKRKYIHGIIHCTGGGQTKIGKFGTGNKYYKFNLFETPPIFGLLQQESKISFKEMCQTYSMGHRLEMIVSDQTVADEIRKISFELCAIDAKEIGEIVTNTKKANKLYISGPFGESAEYEFP